MRPALVALRQQGWRLVVVTNGRADHQLGKLRRTGLAQLLDGWFISEQTGFRKPDPTSSPPANDHRRDSGGRAGLFARPELRPRMR